MSTPDNNMGSMGGTLGDAMDIIRRADALLKQVTPAEIAKVKAVIAAIDPTKIRDLMDAIQVVDNTIKIDLNLLMPKH